MARVQPVYRLISVLAVAAMIAAAVPALAQSTGMIRGKVVDAEGNPVAEAVISIEFAGGITRKFEAKSNDEGEFSQIGLAPGDYVVTASKEGLGAQQAQLRVSAGRPSEVNFVLEVAPDSREAMAAELQKIFDEGVQLSRADQHEAAIAKFQEALQIADQCFDCWYNIGVAHAGMKQYAEAEAAYKRAITIKPDYVPGYNALANLYNMQKKFDEAEKMSAEASKYAAAGGGGAEASFNQAIISWNAGKIAEARAQFEQVIQADPNHAEAHYWLGMANLNEGDTSEALTMFERYLELDPDGQYVEQAKGIVAQLKQ